MFAKDPEKMESFLGSDCDFKGDLKVKGTLRVDGRAEGSLDADCVILSESAGVKGDIQGRRIIIGGRVEGTLKAQERVEIKSKGRVLGDIFSPKLVVLEGAEVMGKIETKKEEGKIIGVEFRSPAS
ncbi:MAG: polymer-forming cytoskeletal protein [Syntrophaceae bacterium]|nr:polymer-forming cytoskeletal protein [Syntrophaceae bacterium]